MQVFYFRDDPATGDVKCEVVIAATEAEAWQIVGEDMDERYVAGQIELLASHPVIPGKLVSYRWTFLRLISAYLNPQTPAATNWEGRDAHSDRNRTGNHVRDRPWHLHPAGGQRRVRAHR